MALLGLGIFILIAACRCRGSIASPWPNRVIEAPLPLGNFRATLSSCAWTWRSYLLAPDASGRALVRASFDENERELNVLLQTLRGQFALQQSGSPVDWRIPDLEPGNGSPMLGRSGVAGRAAVGTTEVAALPNGKAHRSRRTKLGKVSAEWIQNNEDLAEIAGKAGWSLALNRSAGKCCSPTPRQVLPTGVLGGINIKTGSSNLFAHSNPR